MTTPIALSIQQPWAWLIVNGWKDIENRTWSTRQRGPIHVHAGKKFDTDGWEWVRAERPDIPMPVRGAFELGGIVGVARIVGCVTEHASPWFFGPYGLILCDQRPVPFRAYPGRLGFFSVPEVVGS